MVEFKLLLRINATLIDRITLLLKNTPLLIKNHNEKPQKKFIEMILYLHSMNSKRFL